MNSKKSTKKNYLWNLGYQIFVIIVPIITTPYVSRVLGSDGIGKYSFSNSIVYYFTLFAFLGFSYYAQREIAKFQDDKVKQSKIFWEIMILKSISSIIACGVYTILILSNVLEAYNIYLWILSLSIIAVLFDTTFLFQGNEDFKNITIRNFIVRLVTVVLTFVLVKTPDDLWIYTLLNGGGALLSVLFILPFIKNFLVKVNVKELNVKQHIIPTLRLFIPTIAISIYIMLDKTMIGLLIPGETTVIVDGVEVVKKISDLENGYYEQAEKIVKLVMTVVTSLGIVMLPKNASFLEKKDYKSLNENIYKALRFTALLGIPMTLGLISVSTNMCEWFFGPGYEKVPYLMMILAPLILAIGLNGVLGVQYLVATGKDKPFTIIVTSGAILNFVMNIILIRFLNSYGVAIASIVAETSILIAEMIYLRTVFSLKRMIKESYKYIISGVVMFGVVFPLSFVFTSSILNTIILVSIGAVTYFVVLFILRDDYFGSLCSSIFSKIKRILHKN